MMWAPEQAKKSCFIIITSQQKFVPANNAIHYMETIICINEFSAAMMICHITSLPYGMSQPISYINSTLIMWRPAHGFHSML